MKKLLKLVMILSCSLLFLTGCPGSSKSKLALSNKLTVTEKTGSNMLSQVLMGAPEKLNTGAASEPKVYEYLQVGLTVYTGGGATVTVKELSDEEIKLSFDGATFIEMLPGGSINMNASSMKVLTLKRGEQKEIMTEKMSTGATVVFKYEAK